MRVTRIDILGLFDRFDHSIPLNMEERVTLIHGPNGIGKTTVLKLVFSLFHQNFAYLQRTNYGRLELKFDQNTVLRVTRQKFKRSTDVSRSKRPDPPDLHFALYKGPTKQREFTLTSASTSDFRRRLPLELLDEYVDEIERIGHDEWLDHDTGETLSLREVLDRYGARLPIPSEWKSPAPPDWLTDICGSLDVHLIETQRLFAASDHSKRPPRTRPMRLPSAVDMYAGELAKTIQRDLAQSAAISQSLDRSFPSRLMRTAPPEKATEEHIRSRYKSENQLRQRLMEAGLLDTEEEIALPERSLDNTERRVLWFYLEDVERKLNVFDERLERIELFKQIINTSFLYKRLSIDKDSGFVFTTDQGETVTPNSLSSGEQHELVLAYQLLFKVKPRSLILIDEPEISLHVTWQHKFLPDIMQISEVAELDFILATHSPQIIHKRWDLAVPLEDLESSDK